MQNIKIIKSRQLRRQRQIPASGSHYLDLMTICSIPPLCALRSLVLRALFFTFFSLFFLFLSFFALYFMECDVSLLDAREC